MTKISGKFYPLQHDEWIRACQELTPSQRDVLYFIRTLDPYGNGVKITAAEMARQLSTPQKIVHRQTISRALKELDARGFIDMELIEVQVRIKPKGYWGNQELEVDTVTQESDPEDEPKSASPENINGVMRHQWCDETPQVITTHHDRSLHTASDHHTPQVIATHRKQSENQSEKEIQNPKIIKNYSDFKKTLSEDERERFFYFVKQQIKNFREPIKDLEAWLASQNTANQNRWEVYYSLFQSSRPSKAQNEDLLGRENSDGSKTPKRLSLREEIEQQRQRALAYYARVKESEQQQQEMLSHDESLDKAEQSVNPQQEENTDV